MPTLYDEKPLPGDLKRETTADSDIENNAAAIHAGQTVAETKTFSVFGWEVTATRPAKPTEAHTIPRKPVGAAAMDEGPFVTGKDARTTFNPLAYRFDRAFPPYKRYCFGRLSRRAFLLVLLGIILAILALAIGLAVGLPHKHHRNLPLPSNHGGTFTGDLTYFNPAMGACGITSTDDDAIVAISQLVFDAVQTGSNPNANILCGKKIRATRWNEDAREQRSVDLTVVDRCVKCLQTDLDVTPSAFGELANMDLGRVTVTWAWLDYTP